MAGFRLTDGSSGCPPTETPPASYEIPFRFDSAGRLWITSCFKGFRYFGAARHDLPIPGIIGGTFVLNGPPGASGPGISGGLYENITVTNDTECGMGILIGLDVGADIEVRADNLVYWTLASRWNGETHSIASASSTKIAGSTALVRQVINASANPHDIGFEDGPGAALTLAPGESATVGAKLFCYYGVGAPTGTETVYSSNSAVRVYGYILP